MGNLNHWPRQKNEMDTGLPEKLVLLMGDPEPLAVTETRARAGRPEQHAETDILLLALH